MDLRLKVPFVVILVMAISLLVCRQLFKNRKRSSIRCKRPSHRQRFELRLLWRVQLFPNLHRHDGAVREQDVLVYDPWAGPDFDDFGLSFHDDKSSHPHVWIASFWLQLSPLGTPVENR